MKTDYSIPLLISCGRDNEEHIFTIIGDKVIFYSPSWRVAHDLYCAYNSLLLLYKNFDEILPSEIQKYFKGKKEISNVNKTTNKETQDRTFSSYHLVEVFRAYDSYYLDYSIDINKNKEKSIQITNCSISLVERMNPIKNEKLLLIDHCLNMTPKQAFILFANNCVAYFESHGIFEESDLEESNKVTNKLDDQLKTILDFTREYIEWLKRNLNKKEIKPLEILRYNGYKTLCNIMDNPVVQDLIWDIFRKLQEYKTLTEFELILYYTFYCKFRSRKYYQILRRWGKITNELKSIKILSVEDEIEIDNILRNLSTKQLKIF